MIGHQMFEIYGFYGLLLGYVIYTLPISFMLILNTMSFIDKKFMIVSRIMGDSPLKTFWERLSGLCWVPWPLPSFNAFSVFYGFWDTGICRRTV